MVILYNEVSIFYKRIKLSFFMGVNSQELIQLIEKVRSQPQGSPKRQKALSKLLLEVQKLPNLKSSSNPNYPDALNRTREWFAKNIDRFEYEPEEVEKHLTNWINGYLGWRIKDLYTSDRAYEESSMDQPVHNDESSRTQQDTISNEDALIPRLDGLEGYIENLQKQNIQRIGLEVESYLENDPDNRLKQCHPKEKPDCNAQVLAQRIFLKEPPDKLKAIAREFDIKYQTLVSFWKRKGLPLVQEIATQFGYQPAGEL